MSEKIFEYDDRKMHKLMQLGEFRSQKDLLNFALNLAEQYMIHKADGWNVLFQKDDEVKAIELRGM